MFMKDGRLKFSPSDLVRYFESPFASWMDRKAIDNKDLLEEKDGEDPLLIKLAQKGYQQEAKIESRLTAEGLKVHTIEKSNADVAFKASLQAMLTGYDVVTQARLELGDFGGYSDYLVKVPGKSQLGDFHYEVWDSKLARSVRPSFLIQLCAYAEMLEHLQGVRPVMLAVELGTGNRETFRTDDFFSYYLKLKSSFLEFHAAFDPTLPPDPSDYESWGDWAEFAEAALLKRDHLSQIAGITRAQIKKINKAGITTLEQLVQLAPATIDGINKISLVKTVRQAKIQVETRSKPHVSRQLKWDHSDN